jgi:ketosteroid isomerase-like protein
MTMNNKVWLAALAMGLAASRSLFGADSPDLATLRRLNDDYLRAYLACDVGRYRSLLADDFHGVLADGRVIDKAEFLREAAQPSGVTGFREQEPLIRVYGDTALVIDLIAYRRPDGAEVRTRYLGVYLRRDGRWQVISVQFTRMGLVK